jgi:hypothetical protein
MRKILLAILFLGLVFNCYALDTLPGNDYSAEASRLNEELRTQENDYNGLSADLATTTTTAKTKYIYFLLPDDTLTTGADKLGRIYVDFAGTISEAHASVKTAPTGADIVVDLHLNGTTIWSTQANRVTIAASANTGTQATFNTTTFASGDYFTIDLDTVGSSVAGAKLVVRLKVVKT